MSDKDPFLTFLTTVVSYKSRIIHPSIAFDMGIMNCEALDFCTNYSRGFLGSIRFMWDYFLRTCLVRKQWDLFISRYIGVLPKEIWAEINWRNRRIGSFLKGPWFKFDNFEITHGISFHENIINLAREF